MGAAAYAKPGSLIGRAIRERRDWPNAKRTTPRGHGNKEVKRNVGNPGDFLWTRVSVYLFFM